MSEKIRKKYYCENCDYTTSDKKDWNKHILTRKHKNSGQMVTLSEKKSEDDKKLLEPIKQTVYQVKRYEYVCNICNKKYRYNSGLSRHIKKCHSEDNTTCYYSTENFSEAEKSLLEKQQKLIQKGLTDEQILNWMDGWYRYSKKHKKIKLGGGQIVDEDDYQDMFPFHTLSNNEIVNLVKDRKEQIEKDQKTRMNFHMYGFDDRKNQEVEGYRI